MREFLRTKNSVYMHTFLRKTTRTSWNLPTTHIHSLDTPIRIKTKPNETKTIVISNLLLTKPKIKFQFPNQTKSLSTIKPQTKPKAFKSIRCERTELCEQAGINQTKPNQTKPKGRWTKPKKNQTETDAKPGKGNLGRKGWERYIVAIYTPTLSKLALALEQYLQQIYHEI